MNKVSSENHPNPETSNSKREWARRDSGESPGRPSSSKSFAKALPDALRPPKVAEPPKGLSAPKDAPVEDVSQVGIEQGMRENAPSPSSFLVLVAMPGAPSSVLAPSSDAYLLVPSSMARSP